MEVAHNIGAKKCSPKGVHVASQPELKHLFNMEGFHSSRVYILWSLSWSLCPRFATLQLWRSMRRKEIVERADQLRLYAMLQAMTGTGPLTKQSDIPLNETAFEHIRCWSTRIALEGRSTQKVEIGRSWWEVAKVKGCRVCLLE